MLFAYFFCILDMNPDCGGDTTLSVLEGVFGISIPGKDFDIGFAADFGGAGVTDDARSTGKDSVTPLPLPVM